ncbi:hypothetical protein Bbelb_399580, partial [Branchiostoma belcheri]
MDDQPVLALWDTGAQVSIMTDTWREKNLPEIKVRPVIEILEDTASLNLQAANGTEIPYSGWVEVSFKLSEDDSPAISVPFLTTNSPSQDHPIIGYNVIEEIQKRCGSDSALLSRALPVRPQRAAALVNLIEEFSVPNPAGVRVGRKRVRLPRGATVQVSGGEQIMLFEPDEAGDWPTGLEVGPALIPVNSTGMIKVPVTNLNQYDVYLPAKTVLGRAEPIRSAVPVELRRVPEGSQHPTTEDRRPVSEEPQQTPQQAQVNTVQAEDEFEEQRKIVKQMLREESGAFSRDESDIGSIEGLKLKLNLTDTEPVQKNYVSIPAPLYKEVREYIEDLINQGWITKSKSPYSSPMGKAYHQGYMDEESREFTAFVTPYGLYEWVRIPFGLKNGPPAYQRHMEEVLEGLSHVICEPFMDDTMVHSDTFESHVERNRRVLRRLQEHGCKLKPKKCIMFRRQWTEEHQRILCQLTEQLTSPPVMAYPDFERPFVLHTDASAQANEGKLRVIAYGSRTLTQAEKNYHLHSGKLEFLALKWAVTEKFRDYLYYAPSFEVYTDNNPLTYVLSTAKLNATGHRWVAELADYNFSIKYRPGKANADADVLSRVPRPSPGDAERFMATCTEEVSGDVLSATTQAMQAVDQGDATWISAITTNIDSLPLKTRVQRQDNSFGTREYMREWKRLQIDDEGILRRRAGPVLQIVLPKDYRNVVYQELHDKMGHLGADRVVSLARQRFYWPKMQRDIVEYCTSSVSALSAGSQTFQTKLHSYNIITTEPLQLVCLLMMSTWKGAKVATNLGILSRFTMIKERSLKTGCFNAYISLVECRPREQLPITPRETVNGTLCLGIEDKEHEAQSYPEYVKRWKRGMQEAYRIASQRPGKQVQKGRNSTTERCTVSVCPEGDRVLVRNMTDRGGPGKLRSHWEDKIHIVCEAKGERYPVYE